MKKFHAFILPTLLLLLSLAASCAGDRRTDAALARAEAAMQSAPDSALAILDSIDPAAISGQRRRALHALLLSQALDKNYIDTDNDSLINIAVSFYANDGDINRRMLAYYYLGRVKYNAKDYPSTMLAYFLALDLAKEQSDNFWIGLIAREISETFGVVANCDEEIHYAKIAFEHMRLTGQHSHICSTLNRLTTAQYDKGNHDESLKSAFTMLDSAKIHEIPKFEYIAMMMIGKTYLSMERYHDAVPYLQKACEFSQATNDDSCFLGVSYLFDGRMDEALAIHKQAKLGGRNAYTWLCHEIALKDNDYVSAYAALVKLDSIYDHKFKNLIENDFSRLIIEHFNSEKKIALDKYDKEQSNKWLLTIGFVVVIALIVAIAIHHNRKQRKTIEANNAIAEELRQILSLKESQNAQAREAIEELLSTQYESIDHMCELCYQQKDNATLRNRISDEVTATIKSLTSRGGKLDELEANADKYYDGLISHLRSEMPELKKPDYLLVLFSTLGFSITAITILLNEDKIDAVYNRKARLKSKIKKLNPPHAADFINVLS